MFKDVSLLDEHAKVSSSVSPLTSREVSSLPLQLKSKSFRSLVRTISVMPLFLQSKRVMSPLMVTVWEDSLHVYIPQSPAGRPLSGFAPSIEMFCISDLRNPKVMVSPTALVVLKTMVVGVSGVSPGSGPGPGTGSFLQPASATSARVSINKILFIDKFIVKVNIISSHNAQTRRMHADIRMLDPPHLC